ncbi:PDR/VanB family oxidoreductase [Actinomycetospora chibensis]|uniref:PDR/VanB family oxidoreductase n=1 Tax=Actinomycetospora chibensis TaxID=663606 RepID=A0ABV9RHM7_9PSEU|nr:PDR/VanB family oxidoreductase [Actinomycetospora chibensis]MDD7927163.1 PDR/VanB family oxidoreductase [Actinomycetospora chibensis]
MDLMIHERRDEADGVVSLTLGRADGGELPAWAPGAHVDVTLADDLVRQYSLCSDPGDRQRWRLGVLREPESRGGSEHVFDKLHDGDIVEVGEPRNHFALEPAPHYVFVAGGIGITPILPMVAAAEAAGADWTLLYGGRARSSMAFREELVAYGDRVVLAPQDEVGLLDLVGLLAVPRPDTLVYACGPAPMLDAVESLLTGWRPGSLRVERFVPKAVEGTGSEGFEVAFLTSGITATVPPDRSILTVAEEVGIPALWSCREGTCGTCETPLLSGRAEHCDSLLTDEEKADQNTLFICVSRAERGCPRLELDL